MKYRAHGDYLREAADEADARSREVIDLFRRLFPDLLDREEHEVIRLGDVNRKRLADALLDEPRLLKPLLALLNMGKRAPSKDIGIDLDTLAPRLDVERATRLAAYLKPLLPGRIGLDVIAHVDRYQFVDSFVRKTKGRWERSVAAALRKVGVEGKKVRFEADGEEFEIDFACPARPPFKLGVDVKMIGHPSDKQKRGDEIARKAEAFKSVYVDSIFCAVVYYPFNDRSALDARLKSGRSQVDHVFHAGDDDESIKAAASKIKKVLDR